MPHIQVLETHVADLIAAGEVVEQPASVVKELVENAIDAGATALTVEIQRGGMAYIRVTDDGCGIGGAEIETAFLRHATSKIRSEYDLEAIGTLGFRGEALAAIAAVSRVEVLTRTAESDFGVSLALEGGIVQSKEEAGGPQGTTIVVRDLFFNTPARLKYMKKDAAAGAAAFAAVQREALAHPEVAVKFIRDGRQELLTPGDGQLKSAVYAVLGRDLALGFTEVRGSGEDNITVEGFVSLPACCRGSRKYQFFFVNGRYVKSRLMMAALEQAYQNQHMVGKFPGCVLHISTRLNGVDVNVHPAKTEVKFVSEKRIFSAVHHAVKGVLEGERRRPEAVIPAPSPREKAPVQDSVTPNQTAFLHMSAEKFREPSPSPDTHRTFRPAGRAVNVEIGGGLPLHDFARPSFGRAERAILPGEPPRAEGQATPLRPVAGAAEPTKASDPAPESAVPPAPEPAVPSAPETVPWSVKGEVFQTYIIVEQGEKALFIDKHAAHERMNFDRLKAAGYTPMVQLLLTPVVFTPSPEEGAALLENQAVLQGFGFDCEDFGGGAVIVRQSPDYVDAGDVESTLLELASGLLESRRADPDGARDHLLATMACKAAIKGGQRNGPEELARVAAAVMAGEVMYCPHGRPVAIELTKAQLEKLFKRT